MNLWKDKWMSNGDKLGNHLRMLNPKDWYELRVKEAMDENCDWN